MNDLYIFTHYNLSFKDYVRNKVSYERAMWFKQFTKLRLEKFYPGHRSVTRSLLNGLTQLEIDYALNKQSFNRYIPINVGIISGSSTIAITKELHSKSNILIGPNVFTLPINLSDKFLTKGNRTKFVVPSQWVKNLYIARTSLTETDVLVWASGVDPVFWNPNLNTLKIYDFLIYEKDLQCSVLKELKQFLRVKKIPFKTIAYGAYSQNLYKKLLDQSKSLIYIGGSESQGIALTESWAMNVPTFVFSPLRAKVYVPENSASIDLAFSEFSPAPYLTPETGCFWSTLLELESLIDKKMHLNPRVWVLNNSTDIITSQKYINLFRSFINIDA
jgi:hypothetical protein